MTTTHILIIAATTEHDVDTKALCEQLQGQVIFADTLRSILQDNGLLGAEWNLYELYEFIGLVNNGDLDVLTESFLSYVKIKEA